MTDSALKTERLHFVRNVVSRGVLYHAGTECEVPAEDVKDLLEAGRALRLVQESNSDLKLSADAELDSDLEGDEEPS
ncbi:MAG: hypothetical protein ACOCVH_02055 [Verrucomicrobiota bacterium]